MNENMLKIPFLLIFALGLIILGNSAPNKRRKVSEETSRFNNRLGVLIANDTLIQQYENEHKMMYRKEDGTLNEAKYKEWPSKLGDKNLTEYCGKYLKAIIPKRHICNMYGKPETVRILHSYEYGRFELCVGAIKCEIPFSEKSVTGKPYYITEAPQIECVYTLMRIRRGVSPFKIISKICGFEYKEAPDFIYSNIRYMDRRKSVSKRCPNTRIPIATSVLITDYEYKHQKMYKKDDGSIDTDKYKIWPLNITNTDTTSFCAKYLQAIIPKKIMDGLCGDQDIFHLQYTQKNFNPIKIGIIKCHLPPLEGVRLTSSYYYITESPEPDCVYTLSRLSVASVCKIVYQICGMKIEEGKESSYQPKQHSPPLNGANELENKPDLETFTNMDHCDLPHNGTEQCKMEPDLKTISLFSED